MSTSAALPEASYWQGGTTLKISKQIHVENRARVISHLSGFEDNSFIFLAGGVQLSRADTDHELLFRRVLQNTIFALSKQFIAHNIK
jgi:hypothetical protein